MSIFLSKPRRISFAKQAAVRMPHDYNKWDDAIIETLNEQHPYLPSEQIKISISAKDSHKGTAIGSVNVNDKIHIPIVIDQFQLQPFDLFFKNGRLHALSKDSALAALQNLEFGETIPPGQGEVADIFNTHTRAPFDGKYTFAKDLLSDPKDVNKALAQVYGSDDVEYFKAVDKSVKKTMQRLTATKKTEVAKGHADRDGTNVLKTNEGAPSKHGSENLFGKSAMVVLPEPREAVPVHSGVVELSEPGKAIRGLLFEKFASVDAMGYVDTPFFVAEKGAGYRIGHMFGRQIVAADQLSETPLNKLGSDEAVQSGDTGVFWWREDDKLVSTEVLRVHDQHLKQGAYPVYLVSGSNGLTQRRMTKSASIGRAFFDVEKATVYLPDEARFAKVADYQLRAGAYVPSATPHPHVLISSSNGLYKVAFMVDRPTQDLLRKIYNFEELQSLTPSKIARFLGNSFEEGSVEAALTRLGRTGALRISADPFIKAAKMEDHGRRFTTAQLDTQKRISTNAKLAMQALMQLRDGLNTDQFGQLAKTADLIAKINPVLGAALKYAADFDDHQEQETVDSTLGLNLLSDQNVSKYFDGIDLLEDARQFCLKLLLASRVGMNVDSDAARTAAFALDEVAKDLKQLRSMNTADVET